MCSAIRSQEIVSTREGLSNRYVTCIRQGKDGVIWIGTKNGLNIYDGYSFKTYFTYSDGISLSNSTINNLVVQPDGTLFVGTLSGLTILPAGNRKPIVMFRGENIVSSCNSERNTVFISTGEGDIYEIDQSYSTTKIYSANAPCTLLHTDTRHKLWFCVASPKKMYALDIVTHTLTQPITPEIKGYYNLFSDTVLVYVVKSALSLFNAKTGTLIPNRFLDSLSSIYQNPGIIYRDRKGYTWINYGFGTLLKLNIHSQEVENYSHLFMYAGFGSRITCITEDQSGMLWVGTEGGFVKIPQPPPNFKQYLVNTNMNRTGENISVRGIISDTNGNTYFGTYKGLYQTDGKGKFECYVLDQNRFGTTQPLPYQFTWLNGENLLLTSYTKGLLTFNTKTKVFEPAVDHDSANKQLLGLYKAPNGKIWVGSFKGIYEYNPLARTLVEQPFVYEKNKKIGGSIWCFAQDNKGNTWVGSNTGLYKIAPNAKVAKRYHTFSSPALSHNEILSIYIRNDSSIWLASKGGGLMYFNPVNDSLVVLNTSNGLSDNIVYGILPNNHFLWLSTENGLSRFDLEKYTFQNYYERDGINNNEFNAGAFYKKTNGELFFGGINGILSFFPSKLNETIHKPQIILTELSANDVQVAYSENIRSEVYLPYDAKFLSLRFALTDFYEPQFNTFYYTIVGLDDHWTKLGSQNFLRLTNLPAGQYELLVKGSNMNGIESSNFIRIYLTVGQVFYKATWFIVVCVLLLAAVIYLIARFRINQVLQLQKLRVKIASDLHDELGSMLTRISILTELLKYQKLNNPEIDQIASVSRMATTAMSDVLWSIDARNDKIGNLIDRMRDHADTLLVPLHKNVIFTSEVSDTGIPMEMQVRQGLLLIFKEAVNNIAKHSNATEVVILCNHNNGSIVLSICDNGHGIQVNDNGQGLKNMQMRAAEMDALLTIETTNGFCISIRLEV
jgi:signal transduction histidine kinase/ligand-binding sensor domain-containing protein